MVTKRQILTFEEWRNLPETNQRYEIVDGVMIMPPAPTYFHQQVQSRIFLRLANFVESNGLGEVLPAPFDLLIQREPLRTRQPDILYLNPQQVPGETWDEVIGIHYLEVAPDLVIEVLSPSNTRRDIESRLRDYQQLGSRECWLFSQRARTAEILDLTGPEPRSVALFNVDETFRSDLLPGFSLNLQEIFR